MTVTTPLNKLRSPQKALAPPQQRQSQNRNACANRRRKESLQLPRLQNDFADCAWMLQCWTFGNARSAMLQFGALSQPGETARIDRSIQFFCELPLCGIEFALQTATYAKTTSARRVALRERKFAVRWRKANNEAYHESNLRFFTPLLVPGAAAAAAAADELEDGAVPRPD